MKKFNNLISMWEDANRRGALPVEWQKWEAFRVWAIENKYKAEYGYKGEFTLNNLAESMPGFKNAVTVEQLLKNNLQSLKEIAEKQNIKLPEDADTKRKIAEAIIGGIKC